jgi:metal-responsive CopG/Arc/MetJ family transcriptional regulator
MTAMKCVLIRLPASLLAEIDQLVEETYTNRSVFLRQACSRNLDIIRTVEIPAIRAFHQQRIPKLI